MLNFLKKMNYKIFEKENENLFFKYIPLKKNFKKNKKKINLKIVLLVN